MRSTFYAAMLFTVLLGCSIFGLAASDVRDEFKVTEVFLKADDGRPTGPCPLRVVFRGYITVNGPGAIKYTFTRSDGATGPVYIMEFKKAGTQPVMTDWTLGDSRVLPQYAGWQAVKVLSPVEIESDHETGAFEINCGGSTGVVTNPNQPGKSEQPSSERQAADSYLSDWSSTVVQPDAPRKTGAELAAAYESIHSQIAGPNLDRFKSDFTKLKSLNEDLASRLDRAPKSANFDTQKLQEELKTILKGKDLSKLEQRIGEFRDRYEQQFIEQLTAAGIDVGAERQRAASLIGLEQQQVTPEGYLNAGRILAVGTVTDFVDDRPPVEAAPLFYQDSLGAPFISAGTRGAGSADGRNGNLTSYAHSPVNAGSSPQQNLAFVGQNISTRAGARRLHVSVSINDLNVRLGVAAIVGDAAAESAINLRVFDGEREVASRRVTVARLAATTFGIDSLNRRFPRMTLGCEFERSPTSGSADYLIVVEFETLTGSSWFGDATSNASGRVGPFTVRTY